MRVVMLGPPGAGKGTQARLLAGARSASRRSRPATCCARRSDSGTRARHEARRYMDGGPAGARRRRDRHRRGAPRRGGLRARLHPRRLPAHGRAGRGARAPARRARPPRSTRSSPSRCRTTSWCAGCRDASCAATAARMFHVELRIRRRRPDAATAAAASSTSARTTDADRIAARLDVLRARDRARRRTTTAPRACCRTVAGTGARDDVFGAHRGVRCA